MGHLDVSCGVKGKLQTPINIVKIQGMKIIFLASWCYRQLKRVTEVLLFSKTAGHASRSQGCPQTIAHSDFAIYSFLVTCHLLFPNYCRIIFILIRYVLSTHKNHCLALSTLKKLLSTLKFRDIPVKGDSGNQTLMSYSNIL